MDTRPRTPLISFCTVQLRTLYANHSLATLCLSTTSGPDPVEFFGFWGPMVFRHAPIPRKWSGKQQQQHEARRMSNATLWDCPKLAYSVLAFTKAGKGTGFSVFCQCINPNLRVKHRVKKIFLYGRVRQMSRPRGRYESPHDCTRGSWLHPG